MGHATREVWLDGLRGVAAVFVVFFHASEGHLWRQYRSFWLSPASERSLIQLAPFRVIFAGGAMVDIFFVISGYSISTGLVKLRSNGSIVDFYQKLTSSVIRRMFRLLFPVAIMMLVSHAAFYCGLYYRYSFPSESRCPGAIPWGSPIPHIQCMVESSWRIINLEVYPGKALNIHFWTIPVEISGSFRVYLTLLGLATVSQTVRFLIVGLLTVRFGWNGNPEYMAFFAGLLLAELDAAATWKDLDLTLPGTYTSWTDRQFGISKQTLNRLTNFAYYYSFVLGVYLICLPIPTKQEGTGLDMYPPDWFFLNILPPLPWWNLEAHVRTWHTIGAILTINGMRTSPRLKVPFETRIAQFLGLISYSLYLCHPMILHIMQFWTQTWLCRIVGASDYWALYGANSLPRTLFVWVFMTGILGPLLMLTSTYMAKHVDQRSVSIALYTERLLCR